MWLGCISLFELLKLCFERGLKFWGCQCLVDLTLDRGEVLVIDDEGVDLELTWSITLVSKGEALIMKLLRPVGAGLVMLIMLGACVSEPLIERLAAEPTPKPAVINDRAGNPVVADPTPPEPASLDIGEVCDITSVITFCSIAERLYGPSVQEATRAFPERNRWYECPKSEALSSRMVSNPSSLAAR